MTFFGLKQGQDLENRAAPPLQEFPGVPPLGPRFGPCLSPVVFINFIFVYFFKDRISQLIKGTVVKHNPILDGIKHQETKYVPYIGHCLVQFLQKIEM